MTVGIIGLGNLGTALGHMIAGNGHAVLGWEYQARVVEQINTQRENATFLPGVRLHEQLRATAQIEDVLSTCNVVFLALPSVYFRTTLTPVADQLPLTSILVNTAKGIDRETGLTAGQTLAALFPRQQRVMLSGPSIANEFVQGQPTVVMLAGASTRLLLRVAALLDNNHFRVRFSEDEIGVELGGVLKNAYVIGLGMFDGKQIRSVNFRSVYLTLALEEMTRVGVALGARPETFAYLAGMGDLLATALSEDSHNRRMGRLLANDMPLAEITRTMGVLPEGYNTIQTILLLAEKLHVPAPLAKGLWDVMQSRFTAEHFIYAFIKDFVD